MGYHWSDEVLSDLLNKVGEQPDIVSLVITNRNGTVLMAADTKLIGTSFLSPEVLAELDPTRQVKWNATELPDGMPVFQVYKQFSVPQGERRRHGGGHRMMRRGLDGDSCGMLEASIAEGTSLVIFVEYDLTPLEEAQAADEKHMAVMFGILVFVGLVGCITLFLIQSYRRSRKLVQETTTFSSEILRTLPVGIISTDMDDRITSINPAAQDITGLTRTAATGRSLHDLLPGVWVVLEGRTAQDAAREQEAWCTVGERRVPLAISSSHIVTEEGEAIGTALIMRDLGEIRRLQSELRRRDRLVALGNMAAGIAHEVRNPLSAIKGLARFFMEASPEGSDESRMADIMTREVLRLDKVVGDLLDFARPDVLNLTDVGLNELVERARDMVRSDMDARRIRFEAELPEPPLSVRLDRDRMTQVLLNLFLNAVQAMPDGGRLMVRARMEGTELALDVADTGCGIAPERLADIFSPYFTTKASGTGLGLS
ncbi:MAG: two-component system sensor histidine kinase NtrB, partial [Bilophila wadsworthia]